jgi:hypothetical protein
MAAGSFRHFECSPSRPELLNMLKPPSIGNSVTARLDRSQELLPNFVRFGSELCDAATAHPACELNVFPKARSI